MPLIDLSWILSPRSAPKVAQSDPDETQDITVPAFKTPSPSPSSPSKVASPRTKPKRKKEAEQRKRKDSGAFAFPLDSFNIFAAFRGRASARGNASGSSPKTGLRPNSHNSHSSYSGYEDEEYGEPEAEAEEIRRPSGLGRRASIAEDVLNINGEEIEHVSPVSKEETTPFGSVTDEAVSICDSSENEELAEIRYPSGLGNFKPILNPFSSDRPLSTYPLFGTEIYQGVYSEEDVRTPVAWQATASCNTSDLSLIVPILAPYLSLHTLLSLALVNRAVAEEARKLLWKDASLRITIRAENVVVHTNPDVDTTLLDNLSKCSRLASLVRTLELVCRIESTDLTPIAPRRSCPPPLLPPKSVPELETLSIPVQPRTAPLPCNPPIATSPARFDGSISKLRRASSLLRRPSLNLKTNLSDARRVPTLKLRPPSIQLSSPFSLLRKSSSEMLSGRSESPPHASNEAEASVPSSNTLSLPGESMWTPPAEWKRAAPADSLPVSSTPSTAPSLTLPEPLAPLTHPYPSHVQPNFLAEGDGGSPALAVRLPRPKSSLPLLRETRPPPSPTSPNKTPTIRVSPSLPSLRTLHPPTTPRPQHTLDQDSCRSSLIAPSVSPITPVSPISLSAFPLPPATPTPSSISSFSDQYPRSHLLETGGSTPTQSRRENVALRSLQPLMAALRNMTQLTHVKLVFPAATTSRYVSVSGQEQSPGDIVITDEFDAQLVESANKTLKDGFLAVESLESVQVVCAAGLEKIYREQWAGLGDSLRDFEVIVTSA